MNDFPAENLGFRQFTSHFGREQIPSWEVKNFPFEKLTWALKHILFPELQLVNSMYKRSKILY